MAGAFGRNVVGSGKLETPSTITTTCTGLPTGVVYGAWKLICFGETKDIGAERPLTNTCVPCNLIGNGISVAEAFSIARAVPKAVASPPAATLAVKSAPLTTCMTTGSSLVTVNTAVRAG